MPEAIGADDRHEADLGDFLQRPVLISTQTWPETGLGEVTIDPWTAYLDTSQIRYKLRNFAYFRGNLKLKIVISSSQFYYGALLAYYTPVNSFAPAIFSVVNKYVTVSQRPHLWIYPQYNEGGEMTLPYIWPAEYVKITSAAEVAKLGRLTLLQYTPLTSANGATSVGVTIQIYAWCEDVTLTGPTFSEALQSKDEYGNGPISAPASALTNVTKHMHNIPIIGRFARATTIGSSAVSEIAKLFGWSNVPVISNVKPVKNVPFHDLASAHIGEPTSKFTLDPKAEVSVDPRLVGATAEDELAIPYLVQKESFLTSITWPTSSAANAHFFSARVTPMLHDVGTASANGTYIIASTPMSHVSSLFEHWRGDIIFRFKVICSKYHRGRLRITWDPVGASTSVNDMSHVLMTKIIDLAESDEVEFRVPYMQAVAWSWLRGMTGGNNWSPTSGLAASASMDNGIIRVSCLTNLSAPIATSSVSLFVFVRGAENLEFANPKNFGSTMKKVSLYDMQSNDVISTSPDAHRYELNFGEAIPSLRLLLRRSTFVDRHSFDSTSYVSTDTMGMVRMDAPIHPMSPGYDPFGSVTTKGREVPGTQFPYSYTQHTPIEWVASMFMCERGSIRWHLNVNSDGNVPHTSLTVQRNTSSTISTGVMLVYETLQPTGGTATDFQRYNWNSTSISSGTSGLVLCNLHGQPGVSFECPMTTQFRFRFANPRNWTRGSTEDGSAYETYTIRCIMRPSVQGSNCRYSAMERYVCAGTDYSLSHFINAPMMTFNANSGLTT